MCIVSVGQDLYTLDNKLLTFDKSFNGEPRVSK